VSSLRLDIEQSIGLRFPERNGEAVVRFEESLEVPRAAETLMRGFYRQPERVKRAFQELHGETASLLEVLLPRRSRLREWSEELPERPREAETFLRDSRDQLQRREQRIAQLEKELVTELQESMAEDLFPLSLAAFGTCSYREGSVKIYLRSLGRLAEIAQLNPEQLRQAVRVYFLYLLLLVVGTDLDGRTYARAGEEPAVHLIAGACTAKYLKRQSAELSQCFNEWLKAWGAKQPPQALTGDNSNEKLRAAVIFWRRQPQVSWEACWNLVNQLEMAEHLAQGSFY